MRRFLMLTLVAATALAGELNFTAEVDRTTVGLGEPLRLTVTVTGTNIGRVPQPELPKLDGFDNIGSSRSQSTSISIVNGRITQQQSINFVYTLVPKKTGELVIGPCRMEYQGVEYTTEPITVKVTKSAPPRAQPPRQPLSPFDIFEEPEPVKGEVFLVASADRTTVYQGEQLTVTWTFYTPGQVASLNIKDMPALTGFWTQEMYQPQQLEYQPRSYQGKRFYAAVVRRTALFPTQTGELKIGPMRLRGELLTPGFFFTTGQPFEVASDPLTIQVNPLPETGKPGSFTGGVGEFQVAASLSADSSTGGAPITLTITITGTGNIGLIGAPTLPTVTGLKTLAPETKDNFNYTAGKLSGSRRFNYPLLPTADGKYRIPEIEIGFFNPKSGGYYTRRTPALEFVALGVPAGAGAAEPTGIGMRVLGSDIRHIKTHLPLTTGPLGSTGWTWLFYPLGFLTLATGFIFGRRKRRLTTDLAYARRTRAAGLARKRLKQAARLLSHNHLPEFYAALYQTLTGYVGDRFNIEAAGMTAAELRQMLLNKGADGAVVEELLTTINLCQIARFSPGTAECNPPELLKKAKTVMEKI